MRSSTTVDRAPQIGYMGFISREFLVKPAQKGYPQIGHAHQDHLNHDQTLGNWRNGAGRSQPEVGAPAF